MQDDPAVTADRIEGWYRTHRAELVRLAALASGSPADGDEIVQDLFAQLVRKPPALRDPEQPLPYLRSAVLNNARTHARRTATGDRARLRVVDRETTTDDVAGTAIGNAAAPAVMTAVRALPRRQRDVVLLRYWLELSEAEIADTLGISPGTVKSSASRAMKALGPTLEVLR